MYGKSKLVIDLDSTICQTHLWLIEESKKLGFEPNMFEFSINSYLGNTNEEAASYFKENEQRMYKEVKPFADAANIIGKLWEDYEICILSNRSPIGTGYHSNAFITTEWLERNNIPYDNLRLMGGLINKVADIHLLNPLIVIDDEPKLVSECFNRGYYTIKVNHSYNTESVCHFAADSWLDILSGVYYYEHTFLRHSVYI